MAYDAERVEPVESGTFSLYCRGEVRLYLGPEDCTPKSKKGRALLAILAAEQRPLTRVKIIDLLWSERQEEQARASLRTLLADLKEQLNSRFDELLLVDRERVALGATVRTDLTDRTLARPAGELFEGLDHIDPELDEWLRLERERWTDAIGMTSTPVETKGSRSGGVPRWALAAVLLVTLLASALLYFRPWARAEQPVVAVLKFKDLTGSNPLLADGLAEELRIQLAQHPRMQVIGRESAEAASTGPNARGIADLLGADYTVEGSVLNRDGAPQLAIRLSESRTGRLLWSQVLPANGAMIRTGSAGVAAHLAGNINETVGQGSGAPFNADASAYELVFAGRRAVRDHDIPAILEARTSLKRVVAQYPRFAPALAVLAELCIHASDHPFVRGPIPLAQARLEAAGYARQAIAAAPRFGPGFTSLGLAYFETPAALPPLRRAVDLNPGSYEAQYRLARALELAGDYPSSLEHERVAAALEPLDGTANFQLLRMLARTGHRDEIPDLIRRFINRTDDPFTKADFLAGSTIETGDLSTLYLATRESLRLRPNHEQARRSMMWFYIFVGDRSRALSYVSGADSVTAMILRDDLPALVRKVAALGTDFWSLNWETYDASDYLVRHGRSDLVADLFMRTRAATGGKDPQPTAIDSSVVLALRRAGKPQLAEELLGELERDLDRSGTPAAVAAQGRADLLLLRGEQEKALDLLETAQRAHWWNVQPSILPLEDRVVYDSVRDHPRFRAIVRTWYSNVNREKLELASELRRGGNGRFVAERLISPRS